LLDTPQASNAEAYLNMIDPKNSELILNNFDVKNFENGALVYSENLENSSTLTI
jgi:hypothetical protein